MAARSPGVALGLEALEARRLPSSTRLVQGPRAAEVAPASPVAATTAFGSAGTLEVLQGFVAAYLSSAGGPRYDPAYDLNHNDQIGQDDGRILLRILPPISPRIPLNLQVKLAPEDQARGSLPSNSGGTTHSRTPTVVGRTTPGALVFSGVGATDLKLRGPAVVADEHGYFRYSTTLTDGINQLDFQVVDPFGRQVLRAFPIYWLDFAQYEAAHPRDL
ncbi:hypothetical protein [Paludisphaera mucosa]|uniref:Bacterial Ig-like domain-containing protein n=1 Tax=Paludisphaera mucosa TaxID=3030827 RepID=A0ABT6FAZ2_9BACT|nr:hypothetical protein [Paludisphaera mucosa]MDG3004762.1 hypothetical protein [Paludisphaera mucosa]MDG3008366.1 hypothetical protein [Paludisphaera mucosa]